MPSLVARAALAFATTLALSIATTAQRATGAEHLPAPGDALVLPAEPFAEPVTFADELGLLERWQRNHALRDAAEPEGIVTDRPSFTLSSRTVPKGWVQVETGYLFVGNHQDWGPFKPNRNVAPELTLRVGLLPRVELRAAWAGLALFSSNHNDPWLANLQLGFKFQVSQQRGIVPQSALLTSLFVPTGDGWAMPMPSNLLVETNQVAPLVDYIYTWQLTERFSYGGSVGAVFASYDELSMSSFFHSGILRFQWTPQFQLFCEFYYLTGYYTEPRYSYSGLITYYGSWSPTTTYFERYDYKTAYFDSGVLWRVRKNLQLDWRAGLGLNDFSDEFFTGVGLSFRY